VLAEKTASPAPRVGKEGVRGRRDPVHRLGGGKPIAALISAKKKPLTSRNEQLGISVSIEKKKGI